MLLLREEGSHLLEGLVGRLVAVEASGLHAVEGAVGGGEVRQMSTEYLAVYMIGFPLFMWSMVGSTLLRATGQAASPGIVMTTGSVLQMAVGPGRIGGGFG